MSDNKIFVAYILALNDEGFAYETKVVKEMTVTDIQDIQKNGRMKNFYKEDVKFYNISNKTEFITPNGEIKSGLEVLNMERLTTVVKELFKEMAVFPSDDLHLAVRGEPSNFIEIAKSFEKQGFKTDEFNPKFNLENYLESRNELVLLCEFMDNKMRTPYNALVSYFDGVLMYEGLTKEPTSSKICSFEEDTQEYKVTYQALQSSKYIILDFAPYLTKMEFNPLLRSDSEKLKSQLDSNPKRPKP